MRPISNDIVRNRVTKTQQNISNISRVYENTDANNNIDARMKYLAGYSNKQEVLNQIIDSLKALLR